MQAAFPPLDSEAVNTELTRHVRRILLQDKDDHAWADILGGLLSFTRLTHLSLIDCGSQRLENRILQLAHLQELHYSTGRLGMHVAPGITTLQVSCP